MEFIFFVLGVLLTTYLCSDSLITNHFDKPYCEEKKVGAETIKKCYKVVEVNND